MKSSRERKKKQLNSLDLLWKIQRQMNYNNNYFETYTFLNFLYSI